MAADFESFERMKRFIGFGENDIQNLVSLAPVFARHGGGITDRFYAILEEYPETAALIEGRVDALKATHARWMGELFAGDYGDSYFENRVRIGNTHVRIGLAPSYVEGVMTHLRLEGINAIHQEVEDPVAASSRAGSLVKVLDLDLALINLAYSEVRMDRLTKFTGMSRKLLDRCVNKGG